MRVIIRTTLLPVDPTNPAANSHRVDISVDGKFYQTIQCRNHEIQKLRNNLCEDWADRCKNAEDEVYATEIPWRAEVVRG